MERILVELEIGLLADPKTCIFSIRTGPPILILLDAGNLIETVAAELAKELLKLGPFEAGVLGEGPVGLGSGVVDGRAEDVVGVDAGEELRGATHINLNKNIANNYNLTLGWTHVSAWGQVAVGCVEIGESVGPGERGRQNVCGIWYLGIL